MWRCDLTRDLPCDLTRDLVTQVRLEKGGSKPVSLKSIHPQTRQTNFETPFLVTQVVDEIFEIDTLLKRENPFLQSQFTHTPVNFRETKDLF